MPNRSESIANLASSLAVAQGKIENASKDSENPYFKSSYADLASVRDAVRKPFAEHGLAVVQLPSTDGALVTIITILLHESGEWISSALSMKAKDDSPQAIGSAITYARRYALAAMAGVAPEDDDGEKAQAHSPRGSQAAADAVANKKVEELKKELKKPKADDKATEHRDYRGNLMPEELAPFCRAIDKDISQFQGVLTNFRRKFLEMKIEPEFERIVKKNADMKPETSDPAVLKGIILDLWNAMEEARSLGVQ